MGTSKEMVDFYRAGSLVWVHTSHGTWWPGRILGPLEVLPPFKDRFQCSAELPIMLLGRSSNSLDWHNRKSKRVKPFRCGEFDDCIKEAESCESSICFNGGMYVDTRRGARRRDAILHALAIEKKERQTKLKRQGDAQLQTVCREKRLKSTRVSVKSQSSTVLKLPVRPENSPNRHTGRVTNQNEKQKEKGDHCTGRDASSTQKRFSLAEKKDQTKLKRPGDALPGTVCRAKRLKSTRLSVKSQPSTGVKSPVRPENSPSVIQIKIVSSQILPNCSRNDHKSSVENSDDSQKKLRIVTVKKQCQSIKRSMSPGSHAGGITNQNEKQKEKGDHCNWRDAVTNRKRFVLEKCQQVKADPLAPNDTSLGVKQTFVTEAAENTNINSIHSTYTDRQKGTQIMLVDVNVIVEKVYRKEHVPIICMISKTSQKPIIGHPVEIEVVNDSSEIFLGKTNGISGSLLGREGGKLPKLLWRTAKRTPVCYSSPSEGPNTSVTIQSFSDPKAKGRRYSRAPESPVNNLRKHIISTGHTLLHAVKNQAPDNARGRVNCIPVKHIFSRLLTTVV